MISNKIGKLSIFAIKCSVIVAITIIAGIGFPFLQRQMTISVDGVEQVIPVNGLYVEHLQQEMNFGLEGEDYKYDQPVKKDMFLTDIQTLAISTKKIVELKKADDSKEIKTYVHSLSAFLEEQQIEITPPTKTETVVKINATVNTDILRTGTVLEEVSREEEQVVEYRDNAELEVGKEQVAQEGQTKKIVELFKTDDISKNVMLSSKIVDEGITKIIEKGTKQPEVVSTPSSSNAPAVPSDSVWDQLAFCESGGRWNLNTGNGYYGGLQFSSATWNTASKKVGLNISSAHLATREEQIMAATWLQKNSGWGQWPSCTSKLGLR